MKLLTLSLLFLISVSVYVVAQESNQCLANVDQEPLVFGLRLGMSTTQLKDSVPGLKLERPDENGYLKTLWQVLEMKSRDSGVFSSGDGDVLINSAILTQFRGLYRVEVHILDKRVYAITVIYPKSKELGTLEQITSHASTLWRLPNKWQPFVDSDRQEQRVLSCGEVVFSALFASEGKPAIVIHDQVLAKKLKARVLKVPEEQMFVSGKCPLKVEMLPDVRGFRLGMSAGNLMTRHPNIELPDEDIDRHRVVSYEGNYDDSPLQKALNETERKGLDAFRIELLDSRIVLLRLTYSGDPEWATIDEFINAISEQLKLPSATQWKVVDKKTRRIECVGFIIDVELDPKYGSFERRQPNLTISETNLEVNLKERERSRKEREKRDFKP